MSRSIHLVKSSKPLLDVVLKRPRLFNILHSSHESAPLTWVNAPAGSGKTTLVANYLAEHKLDYFWYQYDEEDNDLASFFYHLSLMYRQKYPLRKNQLPHLHPEYQFGINTFGKNFFQKLFSKIPTPGFLVFDDFHCIEASSPLHSILRDSLDYLPNGLRVIVTSRHIPPSAYARLRVSKKLSEIPATELAFTYQETTDLVKLIAPEKSPEKNILKIWYKKTQGWATGLILLLEQSRQDNALFIVGDNIAQKHIFDYFAGEYFDNLNQPTKQFLAKTSLLKSFSAKEAKKLTGNSRASQILRDTSNRHLLTFRRGRFHPVYTFHPLLREFLLSQLEEIYSSPEIISLKNKAATLLAHSKHWNEAAIIYHQTHNHQQLSQLLLKNASMALKQGRHSLLQSWISSLPEAIIMKEPWLAYWLGMTKFQFNPIEARPHFEIAIDQFIQSDDALGAFLSWAGIANCYVNALHSFQGARKWMDTLHGMRQRWPHFPGMDARIQVTFSVLNLLAHISVDYVEINEWVMKAEKLYRYIPLQKLRVALSLGLIIHNTLMGKVGKVRKLAVYNNQIAISTDAPPFERILACTGITISAWLTPLPKNIDGLTMLEKGLQVAENNGIHIMDSIILIQGIHILLQTNKIKKAQVYLKKLEKIDNSEHQITRAFYYVMSSHIEAELGNHSTALAYLTDSLAIIEEHAQGMMPELPFRSILALQLSELGRHDEAAQHIAIAEQLSQQLQCNLGEFMLGCYKARGAYLQENYPLTVKLLIHCLAIGREHDITGYGHWRPTMMTELLQFALEQNIEVEYACKLIQASNLIPSKPPLHLSEWPWAVKIFTLGKFKIVIQGELLTFKGKVPQKPIELLKAIIASGGKDIPAYNLMDKLWPDSEGDSARSAFDSTLQRLRKLLKDRQTLILRNGLVSINPQHCWVDTYALEHMANKSQHENTPQKLEKIAVNILKLYQGDFLIEDQHSWVLAPRKQIQLKLIRSLEATCNKISQCGTLENMDDLLEKALLITPYSEVFYQHLMEFYKQQGRNADAILVYQRCKESLMMGLGVAPSQKTRQLYVQILADS